jgi:hypothetical protein
MQCTHSGRDLLDRHLVLVAEAEDKGLDDIAGKAKEAWMLHEIAIAALESMLGAGRR